MSRAPACPQCGSRKIWKDGLRRLSDGSVVQRWLCRNCGYRFSNPNVTKSRNLTFYKHNSCRVGGWDSQPKNSAKAVKALKGPEKVEKRAAGATEKPDINSEMINFIWHLKKQGFKEVTIISKVKLLKTLMKRGADLLDPESVKETIAKQAWSEGRKENAVYAYTTYLNWKGGTWNPPRYKRIEKLPYIPAEADIDTLIAGCSKRMACFLQLLKETGARAGEAYRLKWSDIDASTRTIRITPEKGSKPRIIKVSRKLIEMLEDLPRTYGEYIFALPNMQIKHWARNFSLQRRRIAKKVRNPRLLRITFHTLRHWKATMEYHKTKDIIHVMQLLGHKNIKNTLRYVQLAQALFKDQQEYVCKVAKTQTEICALVEAGFEYVCEHNGAKIFRKPKY